MRLLKTTRYFELNVLQKRPYMLLEWCRLALESPDEKVLQTDGRIRYYKHIEAEKKFIRVITLEDGETIHNAFFDRNYKPRTH